ncbi:MAG: hypothetical protein MI919_28425 [Holophagales bacterium]|nr:hypothetical protein [Holophagales bacterium]
MAGAALLLSIAGGTAPASGTAEGAETLELRRERVLLEVPAAAQGDPRAPRLADHLDRAAARLLEHLGTQSLEDGPLHVVVEDSFEEQGRKLEQLGPAIVADGRLHVVFHEDDHPFYVHGLARLLLARTGLSAAPWLEQGAALWWADEALDTPWYGRRWRAWIPDLVFARALPTATELLAAEPSGKASRVLFPPVAAAVVAALPGETLAAKLGVGSDRAGLARRTERILAGFAAEPVGSPLNATPARLAASPGPARPFQRGISLAMANGLEVGYHARGIEGQLEHLKRLGADSVSIMPFAYQRDPQRPFLVFLNRHPASETDAGAVHASRRAREMGFRVLWKPHIWVSHRSWPGDIVMGSEVDWRRWWRLYGRYVLHHAALARHAGAELFSVGVELGRTVAREEEWRHLIASVRRLYPGHVTYAGNWWGDYDAVPFWDALDFVGVDAYFPLAGDAEAGREEILAGARRAVSELRRAAERYGRPVLLTEVGFAAREGAWVAPHEEGGTYSPEDQLLAYEVLLEALGRPHWLAGLYVWKVFSHPRAEGGGRPDFRLLGRPAEQALSRYFGVPEPGAASKAASADPQ